MQERVKLFCEKYNLSAASMIRLLDLVSETGELAKGFLKEANYGDEKNIIKNEKIFLEFGDVLFSLFSLANSLDINAEEALNSALEKYERRFGERGTLSS